MSISDQNEQHETEPEESSATEQQLVVKEKSGRRSFSKLRRELNDEESLSSGVQRMLFDEIERLEVQCSQYFEYFDKFHKAHTRAEVLQEKFKTKISIEVLHVTCITVGAAAIGYAPSIWNNGSSGWLVAIFGVVLIVGGIIAKAVKL